MTYRLQQITVNTIFKITVIFVAGNVVLFDYYSCNFLLGVARFFNGMIINLGDVLSVKICLVEVCPRFYRSWCNFL